MIIRSKPATRRECKILLQLVSTVHDTPRLLSKIVDHKPVVLMSTLSRDGEFAL
jgi:hypothetical protein